MEKSHTHGGKDGAGASTSETTALISLDELTRRLYCPEPKVNQVLSQNDPGFSASSVPWNIQYSLSSEEVSKANGEGNDLPIDDVNVSAISSFSLPSFSYLDLRRQQNVAFAQENCRQAIVAMKPPSLDCRKAESLFQEALDLVPDHLDSLVGYGTLLLQNRQLAKAKPILQDALAVDPSNDQVRRLLASVQVQQQEQLEQTQQRQVAASRHLLLGKKEKAVTARESSAYIDALLERSLALEDDGEYKPELLDEIEQGQDEESNEGGTRRSRKKESKRNRDKKRKEKRRRKKRKERKRRKRSRRYDTSSDDGSVGSASASESSSSVRDQAKMTMRGNAHGESPTAVVHQATDTINDAKKSPAPRLASSSSDGDSSGIIHHKRKRRRRTSEDRYRYIETKKSSRKEEVYAEKSGNDGCRDRDDTRGKLIANG